jgi:signal-transduction protein with cAMP-binding, CBS, and nucleotidyltransferase domain/DNA-directed RNA polymerase subunit RPC12/RpoP
MNQSIVHLERGTTVMDAARNMASQHVGSIIVTAGGYPVGIITETDITRLIATGRDPKLSHIEEIMSSPLFSTSPETELVDIANTMASNRIKKMPVVEHQRVIGMITQTDVIRHVLKVCTQLQENYTKGEVDPVSFVKQSSMLYKSVKELDHTKHWHMRCMSCGYQFLNDETDDGRLVIQRCPRCGGAIGYDPTPPL